MSQSTQSIQVESSVYDLLNQVASLIKAVKAGSVEADAAALVAALSAAVSDVAALKSDLADSEQAFLNGALLGAMSIVSAIKG